MNIDAEKLRKACSGATSERGGYDLPQLRDMYIMQAPFLSREQLLESLCGKPISRKKTKSVVKIVPQHIYPVKIPPSTMANNDPSKLLVMSYNLANDTLLQGPNAFPFQQLHGLNQPVPPSINLERQIYLIKRLAAYNPDLVLLQEVTYDMFQIVVDPSSKAKKKIDHGKIKDIWNKNVIAGSLINVPELRGYKCLRKPGAKVHKQESDSATILFNQNRFKYVDGIAGCFGGVDYVLPDPVSTVGKRDPRKYNSVPEKKNWKPTGKMLHDYSGSSFSVVLLADHRGKRYCVINLHHRILDWNKWNLLQNAVELFEHLVPFVKKHAIDGESDQVILGGDFNGDPGKFNWNKYLEYVIKMFKSELNVTLSESTDTTPSVISCKGEDSRPDHLFHSQNLLEDDRTHLIQADLNKKFTLLRVMCDPHGVIEAYRKVLNKLHGMKTMRRPLRGNNVLNKLLESYFSATGEEKANIKQTIDDTFQKWSSNSKIKHNQKLLSDQLDGTNKNSLMSDHLPKCVLLIEM